jgi:hypothetical protein
MEGTNITSEKLNRPLNSYRLKHTFFHFKKVVFKTSYLYLLKRSVYRKCGLKQCILREFSDFISKTGNFAIDYDKAFISTIPTITLWKKESCEGQKLIFRQ